MVRRIEKGGELYECWKMLRVLLQAAYLGNVSKEEEEEEDGNKPSLGDVVSDVKLVGGCFYTG